MNAQKIVEGAYRISFGFVNAFLLSPSGGKEAGDLVLIDTGIPGSAGRVLEAIASIGREPSDLRSILLTHFHADHAGSARALVEASGARLYMHEADAVDFLAGECMRAVEPAPGLLNRVVVSASTRMKRPKLESSPVDGYLAEGMEIPLSGGLRVVYAPGHTAGHCAFLWPRSGAILFAGDAASAMLGGLKPSFLYEDYSLGLKSLERLSHLDYSALCLSHGAPILRDARNKLASRWGGESRASAG